VDISENRLEFAKKWGATDIVNPKDHRTPPSVSSTKRPLRRRGAEVIIECSGSLSVFAENFDILSKQSKYLIIGQTSDKSVPIVPNKIMGPQLLRHRQSQRRHPPLHQVPEVYPGQQGQISVRRDHIKKYPLAEANKALEDMRAGFALKAGLVND
jgi:Zn-dependent alcohol dehydrogenase